MTLNIIMGSIIFLLLGGVCFEVNMKIIGTILVMLGTFGIIAGPLLSSIVKGEKEVKQ